MTGKMRSIEQMKINGQLPSPKGVALAIMEICRRDDATTEEVARVVQTDPALAGRLLRLANSAAHPGRPVASIPEAIMRLGLAAVNQLAMGFSLVEQYPNGQCQAFDYPRFWSHSLLMAVACQELSGYIQAGSPDELFACGLLAHIGCLALATIHPVEYAALLAQANASSTLLELERQNLQVDHNELTAAILTDCGIATALVEPVYYHESPETSDFSEGSRPYKLAQLFYHAKCLADLGLAPETERNCRISELMLLGGKIGLNADELGDVVDRIFLKWLEWGELLKVPAATLPSFAKMATAQAPRASEESDSLPLTVLLVEDDPTSRIMIQGVLHHILGRPVYSATNGQEALAKAIEVMPQIIVTDWLMPVMDGIELCRALRATEWGQSMYVIMLTGVEAENEIIEAFEAGVDDYVTKPVNVRALSARMRAALHYVTLLKNWERDRDQLKQFAAELAISNRRLEHAALTDLLTNLPNRRAGLNALSQAWSASNRSGQPLSVMMIDIDHFKSINDNYGHAVGDLLLKQVAKAIQSSARLDDSVCRWGGEEFLVICHNTDLNSAIHSAERLRKVVGSLKLTAADAQIQTAISIGMSCRESTMPDADTMVNAADKALYAAKHSGRNRTCLIHQDQVHCAPDTPARHAGIPGERK